MQSSVRVEMRRPSSRYAQRDGLCERAPLTRYQKTTTPHQMLWKQSVHQVTTMDVVKLLASVFYWTNSTHCLA